MASLKDDRLMLTDDVFSTLGQWVIFIFIGQLELYL